jgi:UDP-N-acetylglucosamine 4,6-dehydratase/5-epimerase
MLDDKVILVTGGTGSFGRCFTEIVLSRYRPRALIIFSRDEYKQFEMNQALGYGRYPCLRFVLGDVRDREALHRALAGVNVVVHAAALKHLPTAETNPLEFVKTNILGAANLIDAALDRDVGKVVALSSDKAANPSSVYGATKLCADKLFTAANEASSRRRTRFSVIRYGNFVGSRGSVVPYFRRLRHTGLLPITDPRMTRFWITLPQAVEFALSSLVQMQGGEIFVPKVPSMSVTDLAQALAPECGLEMTEVRPGEKLHEVLVSPDDARQTYEYSDRFVIVPPSYRHDTNGNGSGRLCPEDFQYSSDRNNQWLSVEQLRTMMEGLG